MIWFLRGNEKAVDVVMNAMPFSVSVVTYMELVQGMRDKQELERMKNAFKEMDVEIIPLSESISLRASEYVDYRKRGLSGLLKALYYRTIL